MYGKLFLYCEYIDGINLAEYLYGKNTVMTTQGADIKSLLYASFQIVNGVQNLHTNLIFHFDIKPGNFMISNFRSSDYRDFDLKLGIFSFHLYRKSCLNFLNVLNFQ